MKFSVATGNKTNAFLPSASRKALKVIWKCCLPFQGKVQLLPKELGGKVSKARELC